MQKFAGMMLAAVCLAATGCARTPDVQVGYYLPRSVIGVKAVRTVGCDAAGTIHSATAVTITPSFSRDEKAGPQPIRFRALDGQLANSDLKLVFHEDGRLKGVNATTAGKGDEVIKSAIQLAATALGGGFAFLSTAEGAERVTPCQLIEQYGGKEKMITLTYVGSEKFDPYVVGARRLELEAGSMDFAHLIDQKLSPLCLGVGAATKLKPIAVAAKGEKKRAGVNLGLRQPAKVAVYVSEGADEFCQIADKATKLVAQSVSVPQLGEPYSLPIPKAALFGKQTFAVELADSGVITSLQYAKETGAAGLLGSLNAGLAEAKPDSAAVKAAEIKAEADVIAQQQRLIRCQINPAACV